MSSILDALRRIEREEEGPSRIPFPPETEDHEPAAGLRWIRTGAVLVVVLAGTVTAGLWLSGTRLSRDPRAALPPLSSDDQPTQVAEGEETNGSRKQPVGESSGTAVLPPGETIVTKKPSAGPPTEVAGRIAPGATEPSPADADEEGRAGPSDAPVSGRLRAAIAEGVPAGSRQPAAGSPARTGQRAQGPPISPSGPSEPAAEKTTHGPGDAESPRSPAIASSVRPGRSLGNAGLREKFATRLAERMEAADPPPEVAAQENAQVHGRETLASPTEADQKPPLAALPARPEDVPEASIVGSPAPSPEDIPQEVGDQTPFSAEGHAARPTILPSPASRLDEAKLRVPDPDTQPKFSADPKAGTAAREPHDGKEAVLPRRPPGAPYVRVSFLFYSHEPTRRRVMVTVNEGTLVTLFEGQSIEDLEVERILQDEVHFRYRGKLFAIRPRS